MSVYIDGREVIDTTLTASDIQIGAVEIKNAVTDARAEVAVAADLAESDNLLGVQAPALGLVGDVAVNTDAVGTLSGKLRGLVKLTAEVLGPVLGAIDGAKVVTDANGTIQQYLRGLVTLFAAINGKVTACDTDHVTVDAMPANVTASGSITAPAQVIGGPLPRGCATVGMQVTGTWVGTLVFEASVDGTNYEAVEASDGTQTVNQTTTNNIYILPGAGYTYIRIRATAFASGTAVVTLIASIGSAAAISTSSLPAGDNYVGTVGLSTDDLPNVGNAPATPGQLVAIPAASVDTSIEITQADLVPGVKYRMRLTPDVLTNAVHGVWKCSAAGAITSAADGTPLMAHEEVVICLPAGSTKVRVYFWLPGVASAAVMTPTPFDVHVWLSLADA